MDKKTPENSILVLYSGGVDSTLLAATLPERFKHIYLVTFDSSQTFGLSNSLKNIPKIKERHPHRFVHHQFVDLTETRNVLLKDFYNDYFKYCNGYSPEIICLGCKMAMLLESVKICLQSGIGNLAIGHTRIQAAKACGFPSIVKRFVAFIEKYNIAYINPIYHVESRQEQINQLKKLGIKMGMNIGNATVTHQPKCYLGILTSFWLMSGQGEIEDMHKYFDEKLPMMDAYLSPYTHLKEQLNTELNSSTPLDLNAPGEYMHEFSPTIDKIIGFLLTPLWWIVKAYFKAQRKKCRYDNT